MGSSIEDIEFLARSEHRPGVLETLAEQPFDRDDLRGATGASSPTMGRILADFEERRWIERDGPTYELTPLGEFVAERFTDFRDAMVTERKLRDVWRWLPREMEGFSVEMFADATVSYPGEGYPYEPVERVTRLIKESDTMRGFGTTVFKSVNNETVCEAVLDGMEFEYIYSPEVLEATVAWNPEKVAEAASRDNCSLFVHDNLPDQHRCGIGLFDERMGICCHDAESRQLEAVVDTEAATVREWAETVYERYRAEARRIEEAGSLLSSDVLA
ncbi:transcriptional regulator [Halomicroarcula sp. F13]|uniref:Transcriptional regulator n=1 Tax=Haloarcula rubra TaxID=2487747 RepID=A0AAW4PVX8_9EURY|nr:transcriptional regulator [Halomicroarcula rubra]MBX0324397.1 transcriptional regulator [Halomicroarcula rubra]